MTDKPSLAPCPFACLPEGIREPHEKPEVIKEGNTYHVECGWCGATAGEHYFDEASAIKRWNNRAPSVQGEVVERLLAEFEAAAVEAQGAKWVGLSYIEKTLRSYGAALSQQQPNTKYLFAAMADEIIERDKIIKELQQPPSKLGEEAQVEAMCKAYDDCVDELGDQAMERYCNDVPMRAAYRALMNSNPKENV